MSVNTPFGYSLFFGGRYYGLGNVGMGFDFGEQFTRSLSLLDWRRWVGSKFVLRRGNFGRGAVLWSKTSVGH